MKAAPPPKKRNDARDGRDELDEATELLQSQKEHLERKLIALRTSMKERCASHMEPAKEGDGGYSDEMDQATLTQDNALSLRLAEKESDLLWEIDAALGRIADGTYGICEGTGDPIGFRRLDARPWSRNSVQYEEQLERRSGMRRREGA
ncbi:MAG: TraR/DksA family transcriptional regulator [Polyangiales bacterium]